MDYTNSFKYFVFRLVLLYGSVMLGLVFGKGLFWVISSVLPPTAESVKLFLIDDRTGSVAAALTAFVTLGIVFKDDGKKHAAYEDMDPSLTAVSVILMLVFYFVPVILYNPADITRMWETVYYLYYFPCRWLMDIFGLDIKSAAAIGMGIILAAGFAVYLKSYTAYKKKHPFSFKLSENNDEE